MQENNTENKLTKIFPYLLAALALCSVVFYFMTYIGFSALNKKEVKKVTVSPFSHISISGKSAVVFDVVKNRVVYEKDPDVPRPLASLTKVMTALTAENYAKNATVKISMEDLMTEGDSGLKIDSIWKLKDIIDYSLVSSSNDGASAIAGAAGAFMSTTSMSENVSKQNFINEMNNLAKSIGLTNSKFMNEHGLDKDTEHVGAYGSARDMAQLFQYVMKNYPELLEATKYENLKVRDVNGDEYNAKNTDIAINSIPSILASKTGFTDLAGGNLVVAFNAGLERPFIIAVLGSTEADRFTDVLKLASTTLDYLKEN